MKPKMQEIVIVGAIVFLLIGLVLIQSALSKGRSMSAIDERHVQAVIDGLKTDLAAAVYDAEIERMKLAIILCESDYYANGALKHHGSWGDGGKSYGVAQFQYATFKDLRTEAGRPELRWKDRDDQLWLLDWALRHGYGERWSCYQKQVRKGGRG